MDLCENVPMDGYTSPLHMEGFREMECEQERISPSPSFNDHNFPDDLIKNESFDTFGPSADLKCENDRRPTVIEASNHHAIECS